MGAEAKEIRQPMMGGGGQRQNNLILTLFIIFLFLFFFFNKDPEIFFYYSIVWGISLQQGYEAQRHVIRPLNKLALPQSPLQATPLKFYTHNLSYINKVFIHPLVTI